MAGIDVGKRLAHGIKLRQECGGEAKSTLAVVACVLVHPLDQLDQRAGNSGQSFETRRKVAINSAAGMLLPATSATANRKRVSSGAVPGRAKTS